MGADESSGIPWVRLCPVWLILLGVHNILMTVRRMKTYAGSQGYVYQYYFVGKRPALASDPDAPATDFVFDVTSDSKLTFAVSVFLPEKAEYHIKATNVWSPAAPEMNAHIRFRLFI